MSDQQPPTRPTPPPGAGDGGPERFVDDRGRYRLDSRIATGGMGEVWRATDTLLGRTVAVKVLKHEYSDDPGFRARFATEAQHAAALDHPGVAQVYDVGEGPSRDGSGHPQPFLVMELVDGEPLSDILRQGQQAGRTVDREVLRDLLAQAATAIGAAHVAGIIHRDVKPANLLVTRDRRIKITDFGIARAADAAGITQTGQVMGTPQYLSPEQARGEQATPASDVYALGVVAFECLAGRRPFEADSPVATALAHLQQPVPDLPPDVPTDLATVVRTALSKDPADRFPDGHAFAAALRDPATAVLSGGLAAGLGAAGLAGAGLAGAGAADAEGTRVMRTGAVPAAPDTPAEALAPVEPVRVGRAEESDGRGRVLLPVVIGLLLVLLLLVAYFALRGGDETGTTEPGSGESSATADPTPERTREPTTAAPTTSAPPTSEAPATVTISQDDYLGDDVDAVVGELEGLGFAVARSEQANDGSGEENAVTGVSPDGELPEGASVTVSYLGPAPEETPTPTPTPTEEPTADAPGNSEDAPGQTPRQAPPATQPPQPTATASTEPGAAAGDTQG